MTNRERYIDKLSNKELATKIAYRDACSMCVRPQQGINPTECKMYGSNCEEFIERWLSQDADESDDDIIDILGIKYKTKEVECVSKDELRKGQINFLTNEILIDKTMSEQNKHITLIHEVIHGITEAIGMQDLCEDENRVQALATALYYVATHNKAIFL